MIDKDGDYKCNFCDKDFGEFYHDTGNHVSCQDLADGQAQIDALNNLTVTMSGLLGRVMADRDNAFVRLAEKDATIETLGAELKKLKAENETITKAHTELATQSIHDDKHIVSLQIEIGELKTDLKMYSSAWRRELKTIFPKTHEIDSLVITTRRMVEDNERLRGLLDKCFAVVESGVLADEIRHALGTS